jgi:hypothetical protein
MTMKKTVIFSMLLALGVTASAYAANPFSDVPAGHWAYDSVNKLVAAGVVDGYPDGTYGGDKLMTRYEMAQIVAKAIAKGANVDKLSAEFAEELDSLGVRVATLEEKTDNVKITGQIRYEYGDRNGDIGREKGKDAVNRLRSRIYIKGQVNDDWSFTGRIQNDQKFNNDSGDEKTQFNQAYVNGKIGGLKVLAGKTDQYLANGYLYDDTAEMLQLSYGKDIKVTAYYGQPTDYGYDAFYGVSANGKIGKLFLSAGYDAFKDGLETAAFVGDGDKNNVGIGKDNNIWNVSASYNFGDVKLGATYLNSNLGDEKLFNEDVDTDGYVVGASYKGAKTADPGSWGLWGNYYNQGAGTFVAHTMKTGDWGYFYNEGFKGYGIGANVTIAKNMVYNLDYYDLEGKESGEDTQVLWSRLQITF